MLPQMLFDTLQNIGTRLEQRIEALEKLLAIVENCPECRKNPEIQKALAPLQPKSKIRSAA